MPKKIVTSPRVSSAKVAKANYLKALSGQYSYPHSASGTFSGVFEGPDEASNSGDYFHKMQYIRTISFTIPFTDIGYSHDYGASIDWDFYANGKIVYKYDIPFTVSFPFPVNVYPGQRIYLVPTFAWSNIGRDPSLQTTQEYSFSQKTSAWFDAPFDGMDDLSINFTQGPAKANLDLRIPVVPGCDAVPVNFDITVPPFDSGGGEYGGSYTKLGGTGSLKNSGGSILYEGHVEGDSRVEIVASNGPASAPAWKQGHELFELTATVLRMVPTPPTIAAGTALEIIRQAGDFKLNTQIDGSIARADVLCLSVSDNWPYVDVPSDWKVGTPWKFDLPVTVKYVVFGCSYFYYPMGYTVTFDMRGIDEQELAHGDVLWISAGSVLTDWSNYRDGVFRIQGTVPVVSRVRYRAELARGSIAALEAAQPIQSRPGITKFVPDVKLADKRAASRTIRSTATMKLSKPTGGTPQAGRYTVILGLASKATATTLTQAFKKKGIDAFVVPVSGSSQMGVTLGTFTDKIQADTVKEMLRTVFKVDTHVSAGIEKDAYKPVDKGVVQKLK